MRFYSFTTFFFFFFLLFYPSQTYWFSKSHYSYELPPYCLKKSIFFFTQKLNPYPFDELTRTIKICDSIFETHTYSKKIAMGFAWMNYCHGLSISWLIIHFIHGNFTSVTQNVHEYIAYFENWYLRITLSPVSRVTLCYRFRRLCTLTVMPMGVHVTRSSDDTKSKVEIWRGGGVIRYRDQIRTS